jgi:hypothetical protein
MSILQELLNPLSFHEFSKNILSLQPYAAPFAARRFRGCVSWTLLDHIFSLQHGDCWLPKGGQLPQEPEAATGHLTMAQAVKYYSKGHTVLVRHAERAHPIIAEIAKDFHSVFQRKIDVQLYVTPQNEEGFDWHYDVEDVFVIQSQGEKEFRLLANTVSPRPLSMKQNDPRLFASEKKIPEIRCLLKAGDWLYIPSGYWHKAKAVTDSFHLSVGVMPGEMN